MALGVGATGDQAMATQRADRRRRAVDVTGFIRGDHVLYPSVLPSGTLSTRTCVRWRS